MRLSDWFSGAPAALETVVRDWLLRELMSTRHAVLEQSGHSPDHGLSLEHLFHDLPASLPDGSHAHHCAERMLERLALSPEEDGTVGIPAIREEHRPSVLRWLLVGGPGQGKSTLLRHLAQVHRAWLLGDVTGDAAAVVQAYSSTSIGIPRLPLFVEARVFASWLAQHPEPDALTRFLHERMAPAVDVEFDVFGAWLASTPSVLLLDGLDEVPAADARGSLLRATFEWVSRRPEAPILVSSRPTGTDPEVYRWPAVVLQPLPPDLAAEMGRALVRSRFAQDPDRVTTNLERFESDRQSPGVAALLTTPLQIAMVVALLDENGSAPTERWKLFDRYYEIVDRRERERNTPLSALLRKQGHVVRELHRTAGLLLQVRAEVSGQEEAAVSKAELLALLRTRLEADGHEAHLAYATAAEIVQATIARLVLLVARDNAGMAFGFEVRLLQEAMAAEALAHGPDEQVLERLRRVIRSAAWREVVLLTFERMATEKLYLFDRMLTLLDEIDSDDVGQVAVPGGRLAAQLLRSMPNLSPRVRDALVSKAKRSFGGGLPKNLTQELLAAAKQAMLERPWWEVAGAWRTAGPLLDWSELQERLPREQSEREKFGHWCNSLVSGSPGAFPWWLTRFRNDSGHEIALLSGDEPTGISLKVASSDELVESPRQVAFPEDWAVIDAARIWWDSVGKDLDTWLMAISQLSDREKRVVATYLPWPLVAATKDAAAAALVRSTRPDDWSAVEQEVLRGVSVDDYLSSLSGPSDDLRSILLKTPARKSLSLRDMHIDVLMRIALESGEADWSNAAISWVAISPHLIERSDWFVLDGAANAASELDIRNALAAAVAKVHEVSPTWARALAPYIADLPPLMQLVAMGATKNILRMEPELSFGIVPDAYRALVRLIEVVRKNGDASAFASALGELPSEQADKVAASLARCIVPPAPAMAAVVRRSPPHRRPHLVLETQQLLEAESTGLDEVSTWRSLGLPRLPSNATTLAHTLAVQPPPQLTHLRIRDLAGIRELVLALPRTSEPDSGRWTILLGDNGSGKTSLLRGIALAAGGTVRANAALAHASTELVRIGASSATIVAELADGTHWKASVSSVAAANEGTPPEFLAAYGVGRGNALGGPRREVRFTPWGSVATLFGDVAEGLIHAETWLLQFRDVPENDWRHRVWPVLHDALVRLLVDVDRIELLPDGVRVHSATLGNVPLDALSDGYLSTLGWVVDLVARWLNHAQARGLPVEGDLLESMTGVVLLDEIDQHLHPSWQGRVVEDVRACFPRMSFVVTTHNPLTLHGAREGEVVVLRRSGTEIVARQIDVPPGLDASAILTGPWFDLETTLDADTVRKLEEHQANVLAGTVDAPLEQTVHERLAPLRDRLAALRKSNG